MELGGERSSKEVRGFEREEDVVGGRKIGGWLACCNKFEDII